MISPEFNINYYPIVITVSKEGSSKLPPLQDNYRFIPQTEAQLSKQIESESKIFNHNLEIVDVMASGYFGEIKAI